MKRTLIAATIAALTVPVALAAPAHASNDLHIRVDPRDWTWSGTILVLGGIGCRDDTFGCLTDATPAVRSFTVGPGGGPYDMLDWSMSLLDDPVSFVEIKDNVFTGGGVTYTGASLRIEVRDPVFGDMFEVCNAASTDSFDTLANQHSCEEDRKNSSPDRIQLQYNFPTPSQEYELKFFPQIEVPTAQNVSATGNVTVSQTDATDTATPRSKNTRYVTDQPGRVTAMAKRFIAAPGDLINIHGYGPDRDVALARAEHVRAHLKSEIARLGGNPDAYPVMVVYAGDPAHKKGVHVTIHQHAASASTVPDGEPLPLGGDE